MPNLPTTLRNECTSPGCSFSLTPSTTAYSPALRGLYVGVTGNISILDMFGNTSTFTAVPVGFFPIKCVSVFSAGTTASGIIGLGD